jgi:hypothetical protein
VLDSEIGDVSPEGEVGRHVDSVGFYQRLTSGLQQLVFLFILFPRLRFLSSIATRLRRARTAPPPLAKTDDWHKSLQSIEIETTGLAVLVFFELFGESPFDAGGVVDHVLVDRFGDIEHALEITGQLLGLK